MNNQVKVKVVESFKDSQVNTIVCKGKLILIKEHESIINKKGEICKFPYGLNIAGKDDMGYQVAKPIIISETESIELNDYYYDTIDKAIYQVHNTFTLKLLQNDRYYKILVLPEQFSPKHLQAIVDGKLKDDDEVLVECGVSGYIDKTEHLGIWKQIVESKQYSIKLINNQIKLFPIKQIVNTREDMISAFYKLAEMIDFNSPENKGLYDIISKFLEPINIKQVSTSWLSNFSEWCTYALSNDLDMKDSTLYSTWLEENFNTPIKL